MPVASAVPVLRACRVRARADAMSKCGDNPRYGSISCEGNEATSCAASASEIPSSAERKKRASEVSCSTSASVGTTTTTWSRAAATAANSAFAAGVRPLTSLPGAPSPRRPAAVLSRARSVREVEVDEELMTWFAMTTGTFNYRMERGVRETADDTADGS